MTARSTRSGLTLIEMMIASSISMTVLFSVVTSLVFCYRMFHETLADAELTLALRGVRDKLLFPAAPGMDGGLLSGTAMADANSIHVAWETDLNATNHIQLLHHTDESGTYFLNNSVENTEINARWFHPAGFNLVGSWEGTVDLPYVQIELTDARLCTVKAKTWILLPTKAK